MMNDRFDAQLREHLLVTADERPADGQLATVLRSVAGTAQRHPLAARLTWFPGRVGPIPTRGLRFGLVAAALVGLLVAAVLYAGSTPGRSSVFEGTWLVTDPIDGSPMSLVVGAGKTPAVHFVDHLATGGACDDDAVKIFTADGTGTITGDSLDVVWPEGGGCGLGTVEMAPGTYTYDERSDTIVDDKDLRWARADVAPPTRGPVAVATPDASIHLETGPTPEATDPTPLPACIPFESESTYAAPVDRLPVAVTVSVPGTPDSPWSGARDIFALRKALCVGSGMPLVLATVVDEVYVDACLWNTGPSIATPTAADVVTALQAQAGHDAADPVATTLGGLPATRLDVSVASDANTDSCGGPFHDLTLYPSETVVPGQVAQLYIADVAGMVLVLKASYFVAEASASDIAQIDEIVASLRVGG